MIKVLMDTNFFLIPYRYGIDIFQEIERLILKGYNLITVSGVIRELKDIMENSKGADKRAARIALQLIEKKGVEIIESKDRVDDAIVKFARENKPDIIVCTNDRELKRRLKELGIRIINMRGRSHLELN